METGNVCHMIFPGFGRDEISGSGGSDWVILIGTRMPKGNQGEECL
jgi:hypothetical protein